MARTRREAGRQRADWSKDPAIVRAWRTWAENTKMAAVSIENGRDHLRKFHDFLLTRKQDRHYFQLEQGRDMVDWNDARAFRDLLRHRMESGDLGRSGNNVWKSVRKFYEWRRSENPESKRYREDLEQVKAFWNLDADVQREEEGWEPFELPHLWKIVEASKSYASFAGSNWGPVESEDHPFVMVLTYTGQRAQILGLRWDQVDFARGAIYTRAKGGTKWEIPLHTELAQVLQDLRARKPHARLVFARGSYPYFDGMAHEGPGKCEYEDCDRTTNLVLYYGRERDETYCRSHMKREVAAASVNNRGSVKLMMKRVERALHKLYPDLREDAFDAQGRRVSAKIHITSHRFRKTIGTYFVELGFSELDVAKLTGWKDPMTLRRKYWKPGLAAKQLLAGQMDIVAASRAADEGRLEDVRKKSDLELLREQNAAMMKENADLKTQLSEILKELREKKDGGGAGGSAPSSTRDLVMQ